MRHDHHQQQARRPAEFSERGLAFAVDVAIFTAAWALALKLSAPSVPVLFNEHGAVGSFAAAGLFLVYQAFFSCEGRVTVGKHLFGLRVVDSEGEPLELGRGIMRALGYVPSSFFTLGFFWSLLDPQGRTWQDHIAGSQVVADKALGRATAPVVRLSAGFLVIAFALTAGWFNIWEARYLKLMTVASAKAGLREVGSLQKVYHDRHGRYAGSLFALAEASEDPRGFLLDMASLYDLNAFKIKADSGKWVVAARARDVDATLVASHGP